MRASIAGDIDAVLDLMTDDVLFLVPGTPPFGKAQFEAAMRAQSKSIRLDGSAQTLEIQLFGDHAMMRNRLTIEIHARRGDPSNALRHYRRFRRELDRELGVEPGPDIRAAIRQLYPFGSPLVDPSGRPATAL